MIENILKKYYELTVVSVEKSSVGAGSDTYFVECENGKYVVKFPSESDINNPESEPKLCEYLLENDISVCKFIKNKDGEFFTRDENGRFFHVQNFINGKLYDWNTAIITT